MVPSRPASSPAKGNARPAIVLVVEDEILIRAAVAEYLRISGYTVVEAAGATEAIAVFVSGEPIDVVMCDVDLPGPMDGLNLARWINRASLRAPRAARLRTSHCPFRQPDPGRLFYREALSLGGAGGTPQVDACIRGFSGGRQWSRSPVKAKVVSPPNPKSA